MTLGAQRGRVVVVTCTVGGAGFEGAANPGERECRLPSRMGEWEVVKVTQSSEACAKPAVHDSGRTTGE